MGHVAISAGRRAPAALELPTLTGRIEAFLADHGESPLTQGRRPGAGAIMLASNDYLALGGHPEIAAAQIAGLRGNGHDLFMSSVYLQYLDRQRDYETRMAQFLGAQAAVLCQSGWAANDGLVGAVADSEMPVYIDFFAHASLWEGALGAGARLRAFRHNNMDSLEAQVRRHGPGLIVVDAVYSTSGHVCPLRDLVEIAEAHGCMIVVDESHSIGVAGPQGAGLVRALGLDDRVHFRSFSLSKAFVGRGGIVAGNARLMHYFRFQSRPAIFSSAVMPFEVAGFEATLDLVRAGDARRAAVRRAAARLRTGLHALGFDQEPGDEPIVPLEAGSEPRTKRLRDALEARGVFGAVFCAPATPKNRALVRLTVNAATSDAEIERTLAACAEARREALLDA